MSIMIKFLRSIMYGLDSVIYMLVYQVFNLLNMIANTGLFSGSKSGVMGGMEHKIYSILGVVMLFKIAFSLVSYIVNPDQLYDKSAGAASIVKNVIIVIGLTLLVPIIFEKAMDLQRIVLREDILGRIIVGKSKAGTDNFGDSAGKAMATNILSGFIHPNLDLHPECDFTKDEEVSCDIAYIDKYYKGLKSAQYSKILNLDIVLARDSNDEFLYDYPVLLVGITGLGVVYILIMSCISISIRAVKLVFLQMISPIPIAAYLDKKGRDGLFKKWTNLCVSTYLELFVRLAVIYFVVYLIQDVIFSKQLVTYDSAGNLVKPSMFVKIFLVLGALSFAKELPKMIEDMFGVKGGNFTLNPLKQAAAIPLVGGALAAGLGLAGRSAKALGGFAGGQAARPFKALGGFAGNKVQGVASKFNGTAAGQALAKRRSKMANTAFGRTMRQIGADTSSTFIGNISKKQDDKKLAAYENVIKATKDMETRAGEKIKRGEAGHISQEYLSRQNYIDMLKNKQISSTVTTSNGRGGTITRQKTEAEMDAERQAIADEAGQAEATLNEWFNNVALNEFIDANGDIDGSGEDATIVNEKKDYLAYTSSSGIEAKENAADRHKQSGELTGKINDINRKRVTIQEAKKK